MLDVIPVYRVDACGRVYGNRDTWQYPRDLARNNTDPNEKATINSASARTDKRALLLRGFRLFWVDVTLKGFLVLEHRLDSLRAKC